MATHNGKLSSTHLPLFNSNVDTKIQSVLPLFWFINMTISCGATIYRAFTKGDITMISFVTFLYFATFTLDYWYWLYHKLPPHVKSPSTANKKKHHLKFGMWVLESAIILGFAYEFSKFMSLVASISFFGIVIGSVTLLFCMYFVWDGDKNCGIGVCSSNEVQRRKTRIYCSNRRGSMKKYRHLALALENV